LLSKCILNFHLLKLRQITSSLKHQITFHIQIIRWVLSTTTAYSGVHSDANDDLQSAYGTLLKDAFGNSPRPNDVIPTMALHKVVHFINHNPRQTPWCGNVTSLQLTFSKLAPSVISTCSFANVWIDVRSTVCAMPGLTSLRTAAAAAPPAGCAVPRRRSSDASVRVRVRPVHIFVILK